MYQVPVFAFSVDNLPMSEATQGIWASLIRLAGTGHRKTPEPPQIDFVLPTPPDTTDLDSSRTPKPSEGKKGNDGCIINHRCHHYHQHLIGIIISVSQQIVNCHRYYLLILG